MEIKTMKVYVVTFTYMGIDDKGTAKRFKETYGVDALSFSEAEKKIYAEFNSYEELNVTAIKIAPFREVFITDEDDKWYKVKAVFTIIDERTLKEKKTAEYFLVQAASTDMALDYANSALNSTMGDFIISDVVETPIIDLL